MDCQLEGEERFVVVAHIAQEIRKSRLHFQLKRAAQAQAAKPGIAISNLQEQVSHGLKETGWERKLHNAVYKHLLSYPKSSHPNTPLEHTKEPLTYIRRAQSTWEKRILKSLNSMCTELSVPLARKRPLAEQKELRGRWNELGAEEPDLSAFRPVYAPKDFLDMLITLKNPNVSSGQQLAGGINSWGLIHLPFKVQTLDELRDHYREFSAGTQQTGVDDHADTSAELFEAERMRLGRKILQANHSALAQQYAKTGCPGGLRANMWASMLGIAMDDIDKLYYEQLRSYVFQHDLLVDSLLYKDVKLTATNDDQYFVFEDLLYQVLLVFSRDTQVLSHFSNSSANPAKSYIRGMLGVEEYAVIYPPNGIIPFHGFSMYVAPLCFVYSDPYKLYYIFREMYTRHLFRLHTISSHPEGIVSLCILFESLLQSSQPQLFYHLREVGAQPLRIAFKWMMRAFSGYLASDQLLLLWDRILAYGSLQLLAVVAAAIFAFRRVNLMETSSFAAADAVLADLTTLQIIPLTQIFMFPT
ncbi:TBC1 domain family member 19-like [Acanthaster planci]|uniref:TBC1 domain family member 19-like n=1 Tax=Acanthaster planci TaxID=133434 RepID=A0A8B7XFR0_ACAPL|nr:TBC1 domain family member 19-like [Acanthaster planci]XP_022079610.1 TBC1 domain family member 19-like [Acanthaster planci]